MNRREGIHEARAGGMSGGSQRADSARETVRLALRRVESARDDLEAAGAMLKALLNSPQVGSLAPDVGPTQLEIFSRSLQVTAEYFRVPVYKLIGSRSYGAARPRQIARYNVQPDHRGLPRV